MPRAAQVCGRSSQRPAVAVDANLGADFFKLSIAEIVKQIFPPAVLRILETVGHDSRGGEMPEGDVFGIIASDEEIEQAIAIVVKPYRGIGVDPAGQPGLFGDAREPVTLIVVIELGASPFD